MLGERVTQEDDRATLVGEWADTASRRIAVFNVTSETAVVRHTSPVGRKRYVGTTRDEARQACADLDAADDWRCIQK